MSHRTQLTWIVGGVAAAMCVIIAIAGVLLMRDTESGNAARQAGPAGTRAAPTPSGSRPPPNLCAEVDPSPLKKVLGSPDEPPTHNANAGSRAARLLCSHHFKIWRGTRVGIGSLTVIADVHRVPASARRSYRDELRSYRTIAGSDFTTGKIADFGDEAAFLFERAYTVGHHGEYRVLARRGPTVLNIQARGIRDHRWTMSELARPTDNIARSVLQALST